MKSNKEEAREYMRRYMKSRYYTDERFRARVKARNHRRVKALGILAKRHRDEFRLIVKELKNE